MKLIELTGKNGKGKFAIVDASDFDEINKYKWHYNKNSDNNGGNEYAERYVRLENGKMSTISMHRQILGCVYGDKKIVDHINKIGLDNQRINLRFATPSQNSANRKRRKNGTSIHLGVSKNKNRWTAHIRINKKQSCIGRYKTEDEAAKAYNEKAKELHGEFANLNIIP